MKRERSEVMYGTSASIWNNVANGQFAWRERLDTGIDKSFWIGVWSSEWFLRGES